MTEPLSHYVKHGFVLHGEDDTCHGCRTPLMSGIPIVLARP